MDTDTANRSLAFDDCNLLPQLGSANGGLLSCWSATNNDQVVNIVVVDCGGQDSTSTALAV